MALSRISLSGRRSTIWLLSPVGIDAEPIDQKRCTAIQWAIVKLDRSEIGKTALGSEIELEMVRSI